MSTPVSAPNADGRAVRVADRNAVRFVIDVRALIAALNVALGRQDPPAVVRAYHFAELWAPPGPRRRALFQAEISNNQPGVAADQHAVLADEPMKQLGSPRYATCRGRCWQTS
jgi:hypothetical protein